MSETNKNAPAQQNNESEKPSTLVEAVKLVTAIGGAVATIGGGLAALLSAFDKDEK